MLFTFNRFHQWLYIQICLIYSISFNGFRESLFANVQLILALSAPRRTWVIWAQILPQVRRVWMVDSVSVQKSTVTLLSRANENRWLCLDCILCRSCHCEQEAGRSRWQGSTAPYNTLCTWRSSWAEGTSVLYEANILVSYILCARRACGSYCQKVTVWAVSPSNYVRKILLH